MRASTAKAFGVRRKTSIEKCECSAVALLLLLLPFVDIMALADTERVMRRCDQTKERVNRADFVYFVFTRKKITRTSRDTKTQANTTQVCIYSTVDISTYMLYICLRIVRRQALNRMINVDACWHTTDGERTHACTLTLKAN